MSSPKGTVLVGFRTSPILSAIAAAMGGLLFGFDTAVISGVTHSLTAVYQTLPGFFGPHCFERAPGYNSGRDDRGFSGRAVWEETHFAVLGWALSCFRSGLCVCVGLVRLGLLQGRRRPRHWRLISARPHVHRGDLSAEVAGPLSRSFSIQHLQRHSDCLPFELPHWSRFVWRNRMALEAGSKRHSGFDFRTVAPDDS